MQNSQFGTDSLTGIASEVFSYALPTALSHVCTVVQVTVPPSVSKCRGEYLLLSYFDILTTIRSNKKVDERYDVDECEIAYIKSHLADSEIDILNYLLSVRYNISVHRFTSPKDTYRGL